jgi:hypothetical protein
MGLAWNGSNEDSDLACIGEAKDASVVWQSNHVGFLVCGIVLPERLRDFSYGEGAISRLRLCLCQAQMINNNRQMSAETAPKTIPAISANADTRRQFLSLALKNLLLTPRYAILGVSVVETPIVIAMFLI